MNLFSPKNSMSSPLILGSNISCVHCALTFYSFGVFRLTDPPGLKTVLACRKPGLFHPHDVENIYTSALQKKDEQLAGHVVELSGLEFEVVDLRP